VLLVLRIRNEWKPALVLLVASAPYLISILLSGIYTELRLLVPILLCMLCVYIFLRDETQPSLPSAPNQ
jgi:predicted membrane protein